MAKWRMREDRTSHQKQFFIPWCFEELPVDEAGRKVRHARSAVNAVDAVDARDARDAGKEEMVESMEMSLSRSLTKVWTWILVDWLPNMNEIHEMGQQTDHSVDESVQHKIVNAMSIFTTDLFINHIWSLLKN